MIFFSGIHLVLLKGSNRDLFPVLPTNPLDIQLHHNMRG